MKTIQEFIKENHITADIQQTSHNPNMFSETPMYHFSVALNREGEVFHTFFSVGYGHNKAFNDTRKLKQSRREHIGPLLNTLRSKYKNSVHFFPWHLNHDKPFFQAVFDNTMFLERPKAEDILDCLASDASTTENARYFEEWANEMGYDQDSPEAEKTYNTIKRQAADLQDFLGNDLYEELLWETERE